MNPYYVDGNANEGGRQDAMAQDIYVARRDGGSGKPAAYLVINDNPTGWRGVWVNTDYPNSKFKDYTNHDINNNIKLSQGDGRIDLWAPPRSYVIFIPDTTLVVNHPPVLNRIPDLVTYTNAKFLSQTVANDADKEQLTYTLTNNPSWLSISSSGMLSGLPSFSDTGITNVILKVNDSFNAYDLDTFSIQVKRNISPVLIKKNDTTAIATKRFEWIISATDDAEDFPLTFSLKTKPSWLSVGINSGIISGTPAPQDTGSSLVSVMVTDNKGGFDSVKFLITVIPPKDSVVATYRKPIIDGIIGFTNDWQPDRIVSMDKDSDGVWWDKDTGQVNNELLKLLVTWDADSVYFGVDYILNDKNNTLMLYIDAIRERGITNFISTGFYKGEYPKNNRFRKEFGIDLFIASYNQDPPATFVVDSNQSINITLNTSRARGSNGRGLETSVAWDDIYHLGNGLVPQYASLNLVALISGGYDYGSGDAMPDNPDVNGDGGPDSLINLAVVSIDKNGDGIPDPTFFITDVHREINPNVIPSTFALEQNFPNPFNPSTTIRFSIPNVGSDGLFSGSSVQRDGKISVILQIFDLLGRQVASLVNEPLQPGMYSVRWNAVGITSGVYFYSLHAGKNTATKKLLLLK